MNTTGTLTRVVTLSVVNHHTKAAEEIRAFPAGTEVYAKANRRGGLTVRVPGTLFTQYVSHDDVAPAL